MQVGKSVKDSVDTSVEDLVEDLVWDSIIRSVPHPRTMKKSAKKLIVPTIDEKL
jgi:hypothetical protein